MPLHFFPGYIANHVIMHKNENHPKANSDQSKSILTIGNGHKVAENHLH